MNSVSDTTEYGAWTDPESAWAVSYSLPLFHEIDFTVNEGFRRIARGGIEVGGLLFGIATDNFLRIDQFRLIECEHAFGPSFQLSENDLTRLGEQVEAAREDPDLSQLSLLGWFISHSRSDLILTQREAELTPHLFPLSAPLTVLVKPEKFKPTRFAFLLRRAQGFARLDGTMDSVILPLPGRGERLSEEFRPAAAPVPPPVSPVPAIPHPVVMPTREPVAAAPVIPPIPEAPAIVPEVALPKPTPAAPLASVVPTAAPPVAPPMAPVTTPTLSATLLRNEAPSGLLRSEAAPALPELPSWAREPKPADVSSSNLVFWLMLGAAAAFACLAVFGFYSKSLPNSIPVTVTPRENVLVISWPSAETRDADSAVLRINDGPAMDLSAADRANGSTTISSNGGDFQIALIVRRNTRTMVGNVRFLEAPPGTATSSE